MEKERKTTLPILTSYAHHFTTMLPKEGPILNFRQDLVVKGFVSNLFEWTDLSAPFLYSGDVSFLDGTQFFIMLARTIADIDNKSDMLIFSVNDKKGGAGVLILHECTESFDEPHHNNIYIRSEGIRGVRDLFVLLTKTLPLVEQVKIQTLSGKKA